MPKVDHQTKLDIIRRHREGQKTTSIQRRLAEKGLRISWDTVKYYIDKFQKGDFDDHVLPEVKDSTTPKFNDLTTEDVNAVKESLSTNPVQSARDVQKLLTDRGAEVGYTTTRKAIAAAGFTNATPRYCQLIRDANKLKRIEFCNMLIDSNDDMSNIIFTDETSVQLHQNRQTTYRPKGSVPTMCPKPKHPLKVHLWAGISRRGPTPVLMFEGIMKADFFTTEILQNTLLPFIQQTYPDSHRFQQDNDPKHKSKLAKTFMTQNGIQWWDVWPSGNYIPIY